MGFRDESEALRARVDTLERELGHAQREVERAAELERELAETKARLDQLEKEDLEGDEELRAELARARAKLREAEARAGSGSAATEREERAREQSTRGGKRLGILVGAAVILVWAAITLAIREEPRGSPPRYDEGRYEQYEYEPPALDLDSVGSARPPGPRTDRDPSARPSATAEAPPVAQAAEVEHGVVTRRWGTATTDGWRHAGGRCEIVVRADETVVVTCRGEELHDALVPCAPDHSSCATPDDDTLRVDFVVGHAVLRTDEGPVEIELDPPGAP